MINFKLLIKKLFTFVLLGCFIMTTLQTPALADMVSTQELADAANVEMKRDEIRSIMAQDDVRNFMTANGISQEDAGQRLANLSDAEVLAMSAQLDDLPAGQGALGLVIAILVIFILLDVAGVTDIFPGV